MFSSKHYGCFQPTIATDRTFKCVRHTTLWLTMGATTKKHTTFTLRKFYTHTELLYFQYTTKNLLAQSDKCNKLELFAQFKCFGTKHGESFVQPNLQRVYLCCNEICSRHRYYNVLNRNHQRSFRILYLIFKNSSLSNRILNETNA